MSDFVTMGSQQQVSQRWMVTAVVVVVVGFVVVLSVVLGVGRGSDAGPGQASADTATTSTTTTWATTTTPSIPRVSVDCSMDATHTNRQQFVMDVGGDFAAIWAAGPVACEATRDVGSMTPTEQQAFTASGYTDEMSVRTLYGLCAAVNPNHTYLSPTGILTPVQISEVTGMLTLCPNHPQAAQLRDVVARTQAEIAAEAAGELFHSGTFLVNGEIKPGTYAVEGEIANCYWERTDATGAIIDNNFITGARRVEVRIRATDYSFHNEGCGKWRKVS